MGLIKINNEIYGTSNASDIVYKSMTVEEKLDTIPIFDINDNGNVDNSGSDVLTYGHIIDALNSSAVDKTLSANQGKVLKELINDVDSEVNTVSDRVESTRSEIENFMRNDLINIIYPVGSIYMSVNNVSPASFLGGTWEAIKDRFLLAAGSSYSAGSTGGEATHKLIQNEIPNYHLGFLPQAVMGNHGEWTNKGIIAGSQARGTRNTVTATSGQTDPQWGYNIHTYGGDAAHNNMPPYLTVYIWKRIS